MKNIIEVPSKQDNLLKVYEKHTEEFFGLLSLIISTVIVGILLFRKPKPQTLNYVKFEDIDTHENIQEVVKKMLDISQASRVAVALVHDSYSTDILPLKEFSVVYEATQINVPSLKLNIRKVPITECFINKELKHLTDIKFTKYYKGQPSLSLACVNYLEKRGINTKYSRLLTSKKGIYGIIELHYLEEPTIDLYTHQDQLNQLEDCYGQLKLLFREGNLDRVFF